MNLSLEQQLTLDEFIKGNNIFLTGPGGSGKTELIKRIVKICEEKNKIFQVCALTGCAAILLNCNAKTIHSWAGIGLAHGTIDEVVCKVTKNKYKIPIWQNIEILIIDEVSMMSSKLFDILDLIAKKIRNNIKPFGGIQVIFAGDFYQLPPIGNDIISSEFCFESKIWEKTFNIIIELTKIYRQTDQKYTDILNELRIGKLNISSIEILNENINKSIPINTEFKPTILMPRRKEVDLINEQEYSKLNDTEEHIYTLSRLDPNDPILVNKYMQNNMKNNMKNKIFNNQIEIEYTFLENNIIADKIISLKKGTQVMCIVNIDLNCQSPLVNGTQGIVVDFNKNGLPIIQLNNGSKRLIDYHIWLSEINLNIAIKQIPLIYAWALTIHKCQGATLDVAQIDVGSTIFECGQTYVALSRVKNLEGLYLTSFNPEKIKINKKVQEFYKNINNY